MVMVRVRVRSRLFSKEGGVLPTTSHSIFYSTGYVPTTFTRLMGCDNRVQYTSIGIQ